MKNLIKKYWWIVAGLIAAALIWIFLVPHPDRELAKRYENEREVLEKQNKIYESRIKALKSDSIKVRIEMAERSKSFKEFERKSNEDYNKLKRQIVNLRGAGHHKLDSIRKVLFSE
jgi:cytochrome c-type biogenesis protein CcmH/NrfG